MTLTYDEGSLPIRKGFWSQVLRVEENVQGGRIRTTTLIRRAQEATVGDETTECHLNTKDRLIGRKLWTEHEKSRSQSQNSCFRVCA